MFNIVLVHPQIPQNTGAIGRLCVNVDLKLHIVKPTVFSLDEKAVRRAGLDYWKKLNPKIWDSLDEFLKANFDKKDRFFFATTKAKEYYFNAKFTPGDYIFFGGESTGLPMSLMQINFKNAIKIPMGKNGRSLNQAMSVGIVAYEAIRQNFKGFDL
ncbi:tRNA (cytidine(34)-2'-O)-methyltransferase [Campylobacter corcagiensis]|uniref:Putative tRNA (cytidine(34)-2'-O)-methyltransferase n=1 Tax=Campylobacter corcagiensis TaxID=1448857 RepID=A0A7M1LF87_9BACT|nr:tRNA (cytidine(34)-2'-O)-methyltransferase [Campylobacter corcagiensis]QKF64837.1 rRNA methylase, SpoU family [Campylobacter corcagiensis]QOQ87001.1 tRNA (cytidine(34)-2'-O)-methyltransferase [Campylobacter corcagiensis]